jgi:hypothetical protein
MKKVQCPGAAERSRVSAVALLPGLDAAISAAQDNLTATVSRRWAGPAMKLPCETPRIPLFPCSASPRMNGAC